MNKLRYREDLYAKELLEKGFLTKYNVHEMKILVKYYKSEGIKPKERKRLLYEFCGKHIPDFNRVLYFKSINSALNIGIGKFKNLIIIEDIPVKKVELDYINNIETDYIHKKVIFTLLIQSKINKLVCDSLFGKHSDYNFFGGKKQYYKEIFNQSKIPSHSLVENNKEKNDINKIIHNLGEQGIIKLGNLGRINLLFIDEIDESDNIEFKITTFDDVGYYFDHYNGENKVIKCEGCGSLIRKNRNVQRYCKECWKDREKELWKEASQKYRDKNKSS